MILVSMGSQPLKCERIVKAVINSKIKDDIVVQAYYNPDETKHYKNVKFYKFLPYNEMEELINKAEILVVSGTGAIFRALKMNKKVIIFPRLGKYGEAVDNHGLDMKVLADQGYCEFVENAEDFQEVYKKCKKNKYKKFDSNTQNFIEKLKKEISNLYK